MSISAIPSTTYMDQTGNRLVKVVVEMVAGTVVAMLVIMVLDRREPPIPLRSLVVPLLLGAIAGAVLAAFAGSRHVSVFWPYLVVIFGLITVMPWWNNRLGHGNLPLGTIYVNPAETKLIVLVLAVHSSISVLFAAGISYLTGAPRFQFSLRKLFALMGWICLAFALSHWLRR